MHWLIIYTEGQLRRVLDGDSGISFLVSHGTCVMSPYLGRLGETTLMRGHDRCPVEVIGSCHRVLSRLLVFLVPEKYVIAVYIYMYIKCLISHYWLDIKYNFVL